MQHASTAVNIRALCKLIAFCGGKLKHPELGDKIASGAECSYFLIGDRGGSRGKISTGNATETEAAGKYLCLEEFLAVASGDSNSIGHSCNASKRHCARQASSEQKSKKTCR